MQTSHGYPTKPVRLIEPFGAGGGPDLVGRALAQKLTEFWGQPVTVENLPGAGATAGPAQVAKSLFAHVSDERDRARTAGGVVGVERMEAADFEIKCHAHERQTVDRLKRELIERSKFENERTRQIAAELVELATPENDHLLEKLIDQMKSGDQAMIISFCDTARATATTPRRRHTSRSRHFGIRCKY